MAHWVFQVQHVQQDAGQHQQQCQGQQAILQGSSISSVNEAWVPSFSPPRSENVVCQSGAHYALLKDSQ